MCYDATHFYGPGLQGKGTSLARGKVGGHNLAVTRMYVRKGSKLFQCLGEECAETSQRGAMEDSRGEGGGGKVRVMCGVGG